MKKNIYFFITSAVLLRVLTICSPLKAQTTRQQLPSIILNNESLFWNTYNTCDLLSMKKYFTDDVEFYHDRGGITVGADSLVASVKKGLCSNPNYHLRREEVPGTIQVYPLEKSDAVYGAIITGEHYFYITDNGKPEYLDGHARFSDLWILKDGTWRMSRILSYDHGPGYKNKRKETILPLTTLQQFTGTYRSAQTPKAVVQLENVSLVLVIDGNKYSLYPETDNLFFSKDRDLTFEFVKAGTNKVSALRVREKGQIVEELTPYN